MFPFDDVIMYYAQRNVDIAEIVRRDKPLLQKFMYNGDYD